MQLDCKVTGSYQGSLLPALHQQEIQKYLDKGSNVALVQFKITQQGWVTNTGGFEINKKDQYTLEIATSEKPYIYLNFGTKVRYAQLSPDWQSKTTPGFLQSTPGKGRVLYIDKSKPKPGIKARHFDKVAASYVRNWIKNNPIKLI